VAEMISGHTMVYINQGSRGQGNEMHGHSGMAATIQAMMLGTFQVLTLVKFP
jgi:hypothetical protein